MGAFKNQRINEMEPMHPDEVAQRERDAVSYAYWEEEEKVNTANLILCSPTEWENVFIADGEVVEVNRFNNIQND